MVTDPRPDLTGDSHLWTAVLAEAKARDGKLAGLLHGLRCGGCILHQRANGTLRLNYKPVTTAGGGVMDEATLLQDWLNPRKEAIAQVFATVGRQWNHERVTKNDKKNGTHDDNGND